MHRIDDPSATPALPTPLQPGTPGYFTDGSPTIGQEATIVRADWANAVQEELSYVIEQAGLLLSKTDRTQLLQAIARLTRLRLTAPITFYISPSGNDANDGLTTGTAWASITHAYNYIRDRLDLNGFQPTIQLANGTYSAAYCEFPCIGPPPIIQGNAADATQVVVNGVGVPAICANNSAIITCHNFTVAASGTGGDYGQVGAGLLANNGGVIFHNHMNFGACSTGHIMASPNSSAGPLQVGATWTISGSAPSHLLSWGGDVGCADAAISLQGVPVFSDGFITITNAGRSEAWNCQFTGTATGKRYHVTGNGICITGNAGPNYFPGTIAGTTETGGQYL